MHTGEGAFLHINLHVSGDWGDPGNSIPICQCLWHYYRFSFTPNCQWRS